MSTHATPPGVFGGSYASDRRAKPELLFRLRARAAVAAYAARRYLGRSSHLSILDMGCADGEALRYLDALLPRSGITGVEYSLELIGAARGMPASIVMVEGDCTRLPPSLAADSFDMVSALALLEHLQSPLDAVRQAHAALKPAGIFVATCPAPAWERLSSRAGMLREDHYVSDMGKSAMIRTVAAAGFSVLEYRRFMWAPLSALSYCGIEIPPETSLRLDRVLGAFRIVNWLFVNQFIVGRK